MSNWQKDQNNDIGANGLSRNCLDKNIEEMEALIFEQYLYTEEDKLIDTSISVGYSEYIGNSLTVTKYEKKTRNWSMDEVNAIINTIAYFAGERHMCSYISGIYVGFEVILNGDKIVDFQHEIWQVLTSPKLSCKKIAHLKAHELVPILTCLNDHRELWTNGEMSDASEYFR